jgi:hypothetical protein
MFTNATDAKQYTLAGNATVTLSSQRTGARYTFKVSQAKDRDGTLKAFWFVGLLAGADNESDYQYMGVIGDDGFRLTAKSKYKADSIPVRAFQFFWRFVSAEQMPKDMEIRHAGSCGRCGRKLTVPSSIDSGLGPDCLRLMRGE